MKKSISKIASLIAKKDQHINLLEDIVKPKNWSTYKQLKLFLGNSKRGYDYSEDLEQQLSSLMTNENDIELIHLTNYHLYCYFQNGCLLKFWVSNGVFGFAHLGQIYINDKKIYEWENNQPSNDLMCKLNSLKSKEIERIDFPLKTFETNDTLDQLFKWVLLNEDKIINIKNLNRTYDNCCHVQIDLKNNTIITFKITTYFSEKIKSESFGSVCMQDGTQLYKWHNSSPSPKTTKKILDLCSDVNIKTFSSLHKKDNPKDDFPIDLIKWANDKKIENEKKVDSSNGKYAYEEAYENDKLCEESSEEFSYDDEISDIYDFDSDDDLSASYDPIQDLFFEFKENKMSNKSQLPNNEYQKYRTKIPPSRKQKESELKTNNKKTKANLTKKIYF